MVLRSVANLKKFGWLIVVEPGWWDTKRRQNYSRWLLAWLCFVANSFGEDVVVGCLAVTSLVMVEDCCLLGHWC